MYLVAQAQRRYYTRLLINKSIFKDLLPKGEVLPVTGPLFADWLFLRATSVEADLAVDSGNTMASDGAKAAKSGGWSLPTGGLAYVQAQGSLA